MSTALQLIKASEPNKGHLADLRDDIYFSDISYVEVAFEAYRIYRDETKKKLERHVGPYSFMNLIQGYSERYELLPFLEFAFRTLEVRYAEKQ
jgi:hypothetical protein